MKKLVVFVLAIVALVTCVLVYINKKSTSTISAKDSLKVSFSGADGYGTMNIDIDEDVVGVKVFKKYGQDYYQDMNMNAIDEIEGICNAIKINTSGAEDGKLKNGDVIKVKFSLDKGALKNDKFDIDTKSCTVKVSGLSNVDVINVFDNLNVTFEGAIPGLRANFEWNTDDEYIKHLSLSPVDRNYASGYLSAKPGETIKYKLNIGENEELEYGYKFKSYEYDLKIPDDVDTMLFDAEKLNDNNLDSIKKLAEQTIADYSLDHNNKYSNYNYEGFILQMPKEETCYENKLSVVYTFDYTSETTGSTQRYIASFTIHDVTLKGDGSLDYNSMFIGIDTFDGYVVCNDEAYPTFGFDNAEEMKNEIVDSNMEATIKGANIE